MECVFGERVRRVRMAALGELECWLRADRSHWRDREFVDVAYVVYALGELVHELDRIAKIPDDAMSGRQWGRLIYAAVGMVRVSKVFAMMMSRGDLRSVMGSSCIVLACKGPDGLL
jgi:hypothetical protein